MGHTICPVYVYVRGEGNQVRGERKLHLESIRDIDGVYGFIVVVIIFVIETTKREILFDTMLLYMPLFSPN
jgi:hypothetical protein